ncbi:hypothetical protein M3X99_15145 (plasmid) [Clostridium perfringens]|uniref:hypothetical protein n=1 Tax=Clostridium perfringens TaxID=1502 RepID=UPI0023403345|nr:hypothetical protein [Clostridium perfringens]MDC4252318.1 hypothetical protein [Clostridium perfringens]
MAKLSSYLSKWGLESLKIKGKFLEAEFNLVEADRDAAWELYIELITRITTQELENNTGDELAALESIHKIFGLTREIIKKYKRDCIEFSKIAIVILNQKIRPFTAKWHKISKEVGFDEKNSIEFRNELKELQEILIKYTKLLGDLAEVEENDSLVEISLD